MAISTKHFHGEYSKVPLRIAKGHFATSNSHINYYIDMTYTKHRLAEASLAAGELVRELDHDMIVDTVLCLDGTEVLGTCVAQALTQAGFRNENEHRTIYVITPEATSGNQFIFRENIAHLVRNRHVLVLAASVTTGKTIQSGVNLVRYYDGIPVGVCSIFTCVDECAGFPVTAIYHAGDLKDYQCLPVGQCPLCRAGVKLDALVSSNGISSF